MFVWRPFNLPKTLRSNLGSSCSSTGPVVGKESIGFLIGSVPSVGNLIGGVPSVGFLIGSVPSVGNLIGSVPSVGDIVGSSIRSSSSKTSKNSSPSIVLMALSSLRMAWASSGEG